jgi:superfamily II DNA or RNA helicase
VLKGLGRYFNVNARQRGEEFVRTGRVRMLLGNADAIEAFMSGGKFYHMRAERDGNALLVTCNCPDYRGFHPCKHLWALLRTAEEKGYLKGAPIEQLAPLLSAELEPEKREVPRQLGLLEMPEPPPAKPPQDWRAIVRRSQLPVTPAGASPATEVHWPPGRELFYVIDLATNRQGPGLTVEITFRDPLSAPGSFALSRPKTQRLTLAEVAEWPDAVQRDLLLALAGVPDPKERDSGLLRSRFHLKAPLASVYLPKLCATGRLFWREAATTRVEEWQTLGWDPGEPWRFVPRLESAPELDAWRLTGRFERAHEHLDIPKTDVLFSEGYLIRQNVLARLDHQGQFGWLASLRLENGELLIPASQATEFAAEVITSDRPLPVEWPPELAFQEISEPPRMHLRFKSTGNTWRGDRAQGKLRFMYGNLWVNEGHAEAKLVDPAARLIRQRDEFAEREAAMKLRSLGLAQDRVYSGDHSWEVPTRNLSRVVRELARAGWALEVDGEEFRQATRFDLAVTSGIDWFDLEVTVDYDGATVGLPALLKAMNKGDTVVDLPGGGFGVLPADLVERYGAITSMGRIDGASIRFKRNQAGLLDLLLADKEGVRVDEVFAQARSALRAFDGIRPVDQPAGFAGTLRDYQRHGLAWMKFLDEFGFGGCLADDMGVGKTPQVLALLESRRQSGAGPSLAVMPRSLVDNWMREAARFTPHLKVLDHSLAARTKDPAAFAGYHLVIATYGTLRRDAADFREFEFDYVILDEAQAIKNASSESAKSARLLNGRRRLAMTGTPVENHLGELWSLFEFLNPGMLGTLKGFDKIGSGRWPSPESRELLARALRPFILRRTKTQVARELPPKTEQTLYCEMEPPQRKLYDELRAHYRQSLLGKGSDKNWAQNRMHVLEALLRLRQAACHPALLDASRADEASAKFEVLLPKLEELRAEGHKALVFSQFTSLLAILRTQLDAKKVRYEYLDGQTKQRQTHVDHFERDPDCGLFLISLKAGGVGLNLTAADYVFLLDPWWNPAVEAQAIDRTHRIGQERHVFAYRLIARDTVEEKVLELQRDKRELADAIITADASVLRDIKREDLELLLS